MDFSIIIMMEVTGKGRASIPECFLLYFVWARSREVYLFFDLYDYLVKADSLTVLNDHLQKG